MYWYSESSKYDNDGIFLEDKRIFYSSLNENLTFKNIPKVLGSCIEYKPILGVAPNQQKDMQLVILLSMYK